MREMKPCIWQDYLSKCVLAGNRQLYRLVAREIETSFAEARRRLDVEGAPKATG